MSKGGAGGAGRGSGVGGGGSIASIIARQGGISGASYARDGMRDMTFANSHYAGASPAKAQKIATSTNYPVRVHIETGKGKPHVILNDGRHRMTAAKAAGATHIKANVVVYGPRGAKLRTWTGKVKI
jgi:hypothetical protein